MKKYLFNIGYWDLDEMFNPIRSKKDCISLLMKSLKIMKENQEIKEEYAAGKMMLTISKMSRIFYFSDNKYFSINFPFYVSETKEGLTYYSKYISNIDSRITSEVLGLVASNSSFDADCIFEFSDPIIAFADYHPNFWPFFRDLLLHEDGYIRYDYDKENENELLHPLNHYDVFYSSGATFKIGLRERIGNAQIVDLLSTETNCHFLESI